MRTRTIVPAVGLDLTNFVPVPAFDPSSITGLVLRLEGDAGIGLNEAAEVATWADQSGQGNHAVAYLSPFTVAPNQFGDRPGLVSEAGGSMTSATATGLVPPGHARTVFIVARVDHADGGAIFLSTSPSNGFTKTFACGLWNYLNGGTIYPWTDGVAASESVADAPASFESAAKVFAYRFNGAGNVEFSVNGASFAPLSGAPFSEETGDPGYLIGMFIGTTPQGSFKGALGAIVVYDSALADDDADRVREFLADKYGVTL